MSDPRDANSAEAPDEDDQAYFRSRAAAHRRLAGRAGDDAAQAIHLHLEQLYEDRAKRPSSA